MHYFKSFNRVQSTQDEKARFIKGNELKLTQVELFSFLVREYNLILSYADNRHTYIHTDQKLKI